MSIIGGYLFFNGDFAGSAKNSDTHKINTGMLIAKLIARVADKIYVAQPSAVLPDGLIEVPLAYCRGGSPSV